MPEVAPGGDDDAVTVRFSQRILRLLDRWRRERSQTRAGAVKSLVELALATESKRRPSRKLTAAAADLAGKAIDQQADPSADVTERARRKRRLLEGPTEFRQARRDLRK
jgi:hypothetical protein